MKKKLATVGLACVMLLTLTTISSGRTLYGWYQYSSARKVGAIGWVSPWAENCPYSKISLKLKQGSYDSGWVESSGCNDAIVETKQNLFKTAYAYHKYTTKK